MAAKRKVDKKKNPQNDIVNEIHHFQTKKIMENLHMDIEMILRRYSEASGLETKVGKSHAKTVDANELREVVALEDVLKFFQMADSALKAKQAVAEKALQ